MMMVIILVRIMVMIKAQLSYHMALIKYYDNFSRNEAEGATTTIENQTTWFISKIEIFEIRKC
jgi:hypothetical protein